MHSDEMKCPIITEPSPLLQSQSQTIINCPCPHSDRADTMSDLTRELFLITILTKTSFPLLNTSTPLD